MILFCAADLLWATKIKATADGLGIPARPVRNLEMLEARLGDSPVTALIVDLESPEAVGLIERVRSGARSDAERGVRVLAFGPHVDAAGFAAARAAGAERVMARSGIHAGLAGILNELQGTSVAQGPTG